MSLYDEGNPLKMNKNIDSVIFDSCSLNPKMIDDPEIVTNIAHRSKQNQKLMFSMTNHELLKNFIQET